MRFNWNITWLTMLVALPLVSGCSGISASHSVSPASFFLPGLLKADPPAPLPETPPTSLLAQN